MCPIRTQEKNMIIEQRVRDYLAANTGKTVVLEYPERPEASFILAARTGGGGEFVRRATFAIQSYACLLYTSRCV